MDKIILNRNINQWVKEFPIIANLMDYEPVFWVNDGLDSVDNVLSKLPLTI